MSRDDLPTLVSCRACGGEYRVVFETPEGAYRTHICRWCDQGFQTPEQLRAWNEFSNRRKTDPDFKPP